jgi:single-stranded DNA-binding protein
MNFNQVTLVGRLVMDPLYSLGETESKNRLYFKLAVNWSKDGYDVILCICYGKLANIGADYLQKGKEVLVSGNLKSANLTGKDGQTYVRVSRLELGNGKKTQIIADEAELESPL